MDNELIKIYQTANTIKIFTFINFFFNMFNLFFSSIYFIDIFIYLIGYYGAKYFSKAKLLMFHIFLVILSILKFITISYIYFNTDLMTMNKDNIVSLNFGISMSLFSFLANMYISRFAYRLYYLLNNCSDENSIIIRMNNPILTPISLW